MNIPQVHGEGEIRFAGRMPGKVGSADDEREFVFLAGRELRVDLTVPAEDTAPGSERIWRFAYPGKAAADADRHNRTVFGGPPHLLEIPKFEIPFKRQEGGSFDTGREVLARIEVSRASAPGPAAGKGREEMLDESPQHFEQSPAMMEIGPGRFRSVHLLALRFFSFRNPEVRNVRLFASEMSARYRGTFTSSDERLTQMWTAAAYTLRLCMREFLIDGVKRDRLPWGGDFAVSLPANACVFHEPAVIRRKMIESPAAPFARQPNLVSRSNPSPAPNASDKNTERHSKTERGKQFIEELPVNQVLQAVMKGHSRQ